MWLPQYCWVYGSSEGWHWLCLDLYGICFLRVYCLSYWHCKFVYIVALRSYSWAVEGTLISLWGTKFDKQLSILVHLISNLMACGIADTSGDVKHEITAYTFITDPRSGYYCVSRNFRSCTYEIHRNSLFPLPGTNIYCVNIY